MNHTVDNATFTEKTYTLLSLHNFYIVSSLDNK